MPENFLTAQFVAEANDSFKLIKSFNLFVGSAWRGTGLDPFELAVFMNLVSRMDQRHECHPSAQTLADECKMGRTKVFIALRGLKEKGFIDWQSRAMGAGNNVYVVVGHPKLKAGNQEQIHRINGSSCSSPREPEVVHHVNGGSSPRELGVVRHTVIKVNPIEGEPNKVKPPPRFQRNHELDEPAAPLCLSNDGPARKKAARASSFEEVVHFCLRNSLTESDARFLWCHWEGNGWTNKAKEMKSWKDTAIAWRETHRILPSHIGGSNGRRA